jgi:hypothetical protein
MAQSWSIQPDQLHRCRARVLVCHIPEHQHGAGRDRLRCGLGERQRGVLPSGRVDGYRRRVLGLRSASKSGLAGRLAT